MDRWTFGMRGLSFDREWAVIDSVSGRALSAKNHPAMLSIHPTLDLVHASLTVQAPGQPLLTILWESPSQEDVVLRVCGDSCQGKSYGSEVDAWFSRAIGTQCRLVRKNHDQARTCKVDAIHKAELTRLQVTGQSTTPHSDPSLSPANQFSFANESQLLVLNNASVSDLHTRVQAQHAEAFPESVEVTAARFRANMMVQGAPAYQEDDWKALIISSEGGEHCTVTLSCLGPCVRCRMITFSPVDGLMEPQGEPLATLAEYRRYKGRVMFGRHAGCQLASPEEEITLFVGQPIDPQ